MKDPPAICKQVCLDELIFSVLAVAPPLVSPWWYGCRNMLVNKMAVMEQCLPIGCANVILSVRTYPGDDERDDERWVRDGLSAHLSPKPNPESREPIG